MRMEIYYFKRSKCQNEMSRKVSSFTTKRYQVLQQNIRKPILNDDNISVGEIHLLIENQSFCECYKEDCAAWDKENNICRKMSN